MTVINPSSISGITSITMPSGDGNVLTIHTNDGTERFRIDSSGNVKVGTAATISPDGDLFVTGVTTTGGHFAGSGANLTSLPAANITGTLPAISAANLTNVPAANITGTLPALSAANLTSIPAANVTGTLPALTAANLTNIPAANIVGVCTSGLTKTGGFGKVLKVQQTTIPTVSSYAAASTTYQTMTEDTFVVAGTNSNILVTLNIAGHISNSSADRNFRLGYKVASGSYTQINFNPNGSISENMFSDIRGDSRYYEFALSTSFLIDGTWNAGDTITFKLSTVGESTFYHNGAISAADVRFGNGLSKFIFTEYSD